MPGRSSLRRELTAAGLALTAAVALGGCLEDDSSPPSPSADSPPSPAPDPPPSLRRGATGVEGRVLDAQGRPVAGAKVRDRRSGRSTVADARGRFAMRLARGRHTLVAAAAGRIDHVRSVSVAGRDTGDFELWDAEPGSAGVVNSADRVVFWVECDEVATMSDPDLDRWKDRGVDGFVCMTRQLHALGGPHAFDAGPRAGLRGPRFALQRRLRDARVGARARRRGISLYLGFYAAGRGATPFADWFDDAGWTRGVLPDARSLSGAARSLGFTGVAIDQELYTGPGATWDWSYRGNRRAESAVRRASERRGRQLMAALAGGFPGLDLIAYSTQLPQSWEERVQAEVNDRPQAFARRLQVDFWDGMTQVHGYGRIALAEAIFYKTPHIGNDWNGALRANAGSVYALLSREWAGWDQAAARVDVTPFAWVDAGPSQFERARPSSDVAGQLAAFRRWGAGRTFVNFAYAPIDGFDYEPYVPALRAASSPGQVDSQEPTLTVGPVPAPGRGGRAVFTGAAGDDSAVRYVRWRTSEGAQGAAALTPDPADPGRVTWSAAVPTEPGTTTVWLRVEDIKGLAAQTSVELRG